MNHHSSIWVPSILFVIFMYTGVMSTDDRFIKRYAVMKMYESCFGPEVVKEVRKEMKLATAKCSGAMPMSTYPSKSSTAANNVKRVSPTKQQIENTYSSEHLKSHTGSAVDLSKLQQVILAGFNKHAAQSGYTNNLNVGTGAAYGHIRPWVYTVPNTAFSYSHMNSFAPSQSSNPPFVPPVMNYPASNPFYQSMFYSPFYGAGRSSRDLDIKGQLESLAVRVSGRMKNITCIMQELGYLNENMEPDYDRIARRIKKLPVAEDLKSEIVEGIEYCKQFSQCVPSDSKKDKFSRDMVKPMFFFKCYKHKKMEACILKDIRSRYAPEDIEDNMVAIDRNDRSNHELNNKDVAELALYEFLYASDSNIDFDEL